MKPFELPNEADLGRSLAPSISAGFKTPLFDSYQLERDATRYKLLFFAS